MLDLSIDQNLTSLIAFHIVEFSVDSQDFVDAVVFLRKSPGRYLGSPIHQFDNLVGDYLTMIPTRRYSILNQVPQNFFPNYSCYNQVLKLTLIPMAAGFDSVAAYFAFCSSNALRAHHASNCFILTGSGKSALICL